MSLQSCESALWREGASWLVVVSLKEHNETSVEKVEKNCDLQSGVATEAKC